MGVPKYPEDLYEMNIKMALARAGIPYTDQNARKARDICWDAFYNYVSCASSALVEKIQETDVKWEGVYTIDSFVPDEEIEKVEFSFLLDEEVPEVGAADVGMSTESILSSLISVAGNICKIHSSDIFFLWWDLLDETQSSDYKGGKYLFGFRENGIDDTRTLLIKYNSRERDKIKKIYVLEVEVVPSSEEYRRINAVTMTLSMAKEVPSW